MVHPSDEMWLILQKNGGMERTGDEKDDEGAGNGRGRKYINNDGRNREGGGHHILIFQHFPIQK